MEERIIILTRGIQASGKSTYALNWVKESPETRIRFNWDSLRNMFGEYCVPKREKSCLISNITNTFLETAMTDGWNIIIDNMNLNPKYWDNIQNKIDLFNIKHTDIKYKLEFKDFFSTPIEECIRRDSMRELPIGEKVIKQTYRKYRSFIAKELCNSYYNNIKKYDDTKKNCIIVDMDATLCYNLSGRPFYGEGSAEGMINDIPSKPIIDLVEQYTKNDNIDVIVLTGREDTESSRIATETWLINNVKGKVNKVLMREKNNYISGPECKLSIYKKEIEPYYNVLFVLEDSSKVVKMWRDNGITCLQVNDGTM